MKSSITANGAAALYERNDLVAKVFGRCGIGLDGRSSPDWPRCCDDPHPIGRSLVGAGQAEAQRLCPQQGGGGRLRRWARSIVPKW